MKMDNKECVSQLTIYKMNKRGLYRNKDWHRMIYACIRNLYAYDIYRIESCSNDTWLMQLLATLQWKEKPVLCCKP